MSHPQYQQGKVVEDAVQGDAVALFKVIFLVETSSAKSS